MVPNGHELCCGQVFEVIVTGLVSKSLQKVLAVWFRCGGHGLRVLAKILCPVRKMCTVYLWWAHVRLYVCLAENPHSTFPSDGEVLDSSVFVTTYWATTSLIFWRSFVTFEERSLPLFHIMVVQCIYLYRIAWHGILIRLSSSHSCEYGKL